MSAAAAHDHVCWIYRDDADLGALTSDVVTAGLARGERVLCIGDRVADALRSAPPAVGGVAASVAAGSLQFLTLAEACAAGNAFTAERQWAFHDEAVRRALRDGYTGLRVLAEVSALAADPATRSELGRWEHMADRHIGGGSGMSAVCAYREDVARPALSDVAAVHPLVHGPAGTSPFRLFFDDDRLTLAGDVDVMGAERLARLLSTTPVRGDACVLDLRHLQFADVAACRVIAGWVRALADREVRLTMQNAPALLVRMWHLLALDGCGAVSFSAAA